MITEFSKAAQAAEDRGDRDSARRIRMEGRIAAAIVEAALVRGLTVSVCDSEEITVRRSTNKTEIMQALFTTDEDQIILHEAGTETGRIGYFYMVYGNSGYDVVCDYIISPTIEEIYNSVVEPLADKLEAECV